MEACTTSALENVPWSLPGGISFKGAGPWSHPSFCCGSFLTSWSRSLGRAAACSHLSFSCHLWAWWPGLGACLPSSGDCTGGCGPRVCGGVVGLSAMMPTERGCPLLGNSTCPSALSPLASRLSSRRVHACAPSSGVSCSGFTQGLDPPLCLYGLPGPKGTTLRTGADPAAWVPGGRSWGL